MKELKNTLRTKSLELQLHLDTHGHQESAHEPQQWWLTINNKKQFMPQSMLGASTNSQHALQHE